MRIDSLKLCKVMFGITLAVLFLGQLSVLGKSNGFNVYLFDISVVVCNVVLLLVLLRKQHMFMYSLAQVFFGGFIVTGVLGYSRWLGDFKPLELVIAMSYLVRLVNYLFFWFLVQNAVLNGILTKSFIVRVVLILGAIFVTFGVIQLLILPDFSLLDPTLGWDPHKNRLASTFFDPNFAGAFICILIAFAVKARLSLGRFSFVITYLVLALLLTFSRSAWAMLGIGVLIYGALNSRKLLLVALLVFLCAFFAIPRVQTRLSGITDPADSAHFRLISWRESLHLFFKSPVVGHGYNALRYTNKYYGSLSYDAFLKHSASGSDSSFLYVLATTGIIGLAFFIPHLIMLFIQLFRLKDVWGLGMLSGLVLESQFINSYFYPQIMLLLFMYLVVSQTPVDRLDRRTPIERSSKPLVSGT